MKVNVLFFSTPVDWRGGENQIFELIKEMQHTANCHVFSPESSELSKRVNQTNISLFNYKKNFFSVFTAAYKLKKICDNYNIDVIHNNDSNAQTISYISNLLFKNMTSCVLSKRTVFTFSKGKLSKLKYSNKNLKKIICVSEASKKVVLENYKKPDNVCVVNNGIDIKKYQLTKTNRLEKEFEISKENFKIGFLGALSSEKGIHFLIDAFAQLRRDFKNITLVIIGEGVLKNELSEQIEVLNISDFVIFTGFRNDIPKLLQELDIFVLPSLAEGYPNVILESFACKTAVVASDAGGIPEIISDNKNGLIFESGNVKMLKEKLLLLYNNPDLSNKLIDNAYQDVISKQTIGVTSKRIYSIYQEVIKK